MRFRLWQADRMDLTPGEKAVLGQIRVLYSAAAARDQQLKALMMQWPPVHCDAYRKAYGGLLAKALIQDVGAQVFRITDAGLKEIGVSTVAQPRPQPRPVVEMRPAAPAAMVKPRAGFLSRLFRARA
jgi:hypothetical protein